MPGKVEAAEGGTLFLDEIGDLPFGSQAKLLQLLQSKHYYPLGATRPMPADVRILAATNADLEKRVEEKRFREDLFYRLNVVPVRLPSLSERKEDVRDLSDALCERVRRRHALPPLRISLAAVRAIEAAEWPGNVRQLENAIESAAIRAAGEGTPELGVRHLFPDRAPEDPEAEGRTFQAAVREFQRDLLQRTLRETGWNVSETSRRLDLARSYVYELIRAFGLERD
jgi:Nif-specific regulatory protein